MQFEYIKDLLDKYDKVGPRYTSYPTAPEWKSDFDFTIWQETVKSNKDKPQEISLYLHIPFCKSACYYCACNIVISPHGDLTEPYLAAIKQEINLLKVNLGEQVKVKQLHFGGGTPTYLSISQFTDLMHCIKSNFELDLSPELSIEIDPRVTSFEQLTALRQMGFNRLSMGVQDFTPEVQIAVNRRQSYKEVQEMCAYCQELGYESLNFDLIYGLPLQNLVSFEQTLEQVLRISPDRIALFNYAHLPSLRPFQKAYIKENDLPERQTKVAIFLQALQILQEAGYEFIGMDHFAKKNDELCLARQNRTLHRNFQGYTTKAGLQLFGLGMTSISSIGNIYSQNQKKLNRYLEHFSKPNTTELPLEKGIKLSKEDVLRRAIINKILCHGVLIFGEIQEEFDLDFTQYFARELQDLQVLAKDGLLTITPQKIEISSVGRIFLRNIAMTFDLYLRAGHPKLFSRTI